jgi:hypothetical protein
MDPVGRAEASGLGVRVAADQAAGGSAAVEDSGVEDLAAAVAVVADAAAEIRIAAGLITAVMPVSAIGVALSRLSRVPSSRTWRIPLSMRLPFP